MKSLKCYYEKTSRDTTVCVTAKPQSINVRGSLFWITFAIAQRPSKVLPCLYVRHSNLVTRLVCSSTRVYFILLYPTCDIIYNLLL